MISCFVRLGRRRNLFANLSRVVIEGSRGLCKRLKRQEEGSWTDLKKKLDKNTLLTVRAAESP